MSKILIIDSSTEACSVALSNGAEVVSRFEIAPRRHAELLLPMVEQVLEQSQLTLVELDAIGCCVGPGAFTGLRIAISVAQGLAYASNRPCVEISSLAAMAAHSFSINDSECCLVSIDARMNEVYFGSFRRDENDLPVANIQEQVIQPGQIELSESLIKTAITSKNNRPNCSIAGNGWAAYSYSDSFADICRLECEIQYPRANMMVKLAQSIYQNESLKKAAELRPRYLRNNVAKKKSQQK